MASIKHLDEEGLSKVWGKAKAAFSDKVETQNALNKKFELPSGGTAGQVLTKTEDGVVWADGSGGSEPIVPDPELPDLPDGYTAVEFITCTGKQYIDTGIKPNQDTCLETRFITIGTEDTMGFFGARAAIGEPSYGYFSSTSGRIPRFDYNTTPVSLDERPEAVTKIKIENNELLVNDTKSYAISASTFSLTNNLYFGAYNTGDSVINGHYFKGNIYYFKLWDKSGTVFLNLVAAKRDSDGVYGFYDLQNNKFLSSDTSTQFTYTELSGEDFPGLNPNLEIISKVDFTGSSVVDQASIVNDANIKYISNRGNYTILLKTPGVYKVDCGTYFSTTSSLEDTDLLLTLPESNFSFDMSAFAKNEISDYVVSNGTTSIVFSASFKSTVEYYLYLHVEKIDNYDADTAYISVRQETDYGTGTNSPEIMNVYSAYNMAYEFNKTTGLVTYTFKHNGNYAIMFDSFPTVNTESPNLIVDILLGDRKILDHIGAYAANIFGIIPKIQFQVTDFETQKLTVRLYNNMDRTREMVVKYRIISE